MQPAGDLQRFSICDVAIRSEPVPSASADATRSGTRSSATRPGPVHGAERATSFGERGVQRVHVGGRAGFPNDRRRAANVVGMTVRENQVPEIARGASELPDRIEHS